MELQDLWPRPLRHHNLKRDTMHQNDRREFANFGRGWLLHKPDFRFIISARI